MLPVKGPAALVAMAWWEIAGRDPSWCPSLLVRVSNGGSQKGRAYCATQIPYSHRNCGLLWLSKWGNLENLLLVIRPKNLWLPLLFVQICDKRNAYQLQDIWLVCPRYFVFLFITDHEFPI